MAEYLDQYHHTPSDVAVLSMFSDPHWVGDFAVDVDVRRGDAGA